MALPCSAPSEAGREIRAVEMEIAQYVPGGSTLCPCVTRKRRKKNPGLNWPWRRFVQIIAIPEEVLY